MERLDDIIVKKLGITKTKAQKYIKDGLVRIKGEIVTKPGTKIKTEKIEEIYEKIEVDQEKYRYVSQGAIKLKTAIEKFDIQITGKNCIDMGASTGGFTEVLIEKGANYIAAVDVGTNQLDEKIRINEKVESYENTDIREMVWKDKKLHLIVGDLSFISLKKIYKKLIDLSPEEMLLLVKPQFEVGEKVARKFEGVITDFKIIEKVTQDIIEYYTKEGIYELKGKVIVPKINEEKTRNTETIIYLKKVFKES